jgi:Xaa-Pro aminopeptidase
MSARLEKLRRRLAEEQLDAILVSQAENRRYLSGFTGSAGFLLISPESAVLATDSRYTEQEENQANDFHIHRIEGEMQKWLAELIHSVETKKVGFESNGLSFHTYRQLVVAAGEKELVPTDGLVESLRAVKDKGELESIMRAVELSDAAFDEVEPTIRPGITEREVAWALEKSMREKGSEPMPFHIIVASGPNAALAHHTPSERPIGEGEPVVIDMGARIADYCSDLTRTVCPGKGDEVFDRIYHLVLQAQLAAANGISKGMSGEQADALARTVIQEGGHGEDFGHGLGHGVGLAPHEQPRLGKGSQDILADGMVFTIEPGIYISGWGGVRIEDTAVLEGGKAKVLSRAGKLY